MARWRRCGNGTLPRAWARISANRYTCSAARSGSKAGNSLRNWMARPAVRLRSARCHAATP
eukprot:169339-Lingulodinium_polyedra.AAC.1